jgi:Methylase involved in ubiquinone/menaquinone biosynthesis
MERYDLEEVRKCYDLAAREYARRFHGELEGKCFDRMILDRFAGYFDGRSRILDLGTGSGHVADYLYARGLHNVIGLDISEESLRIARDSYPYISFESRNMLDTGLAEASVDGIVCAYGIVHFTYEEIGLAIREWKRIVRKGGKVLFAFHVGADASITVDRFLDIEGARATWNFFAVDKVLKLLSENEVIYDDVVIRYPYALVEHPSMRCYIEFTRR